MMEEASLFGSPEGMRVEHIQITEQGLVIEIEASHPTSCCPLCTQPSDSIKTHYRRVLRDAPCAGRQVQLILTVRKFYCRNAYCSQKVFGERLPTFVEPWARMTIQGSQQITSIGLATCGRGSQACCSPGDTNDEADDLAPHHGFAKCLGWLSGYLGIDDFSFRRRYRFGTTWLTSKVTAWSISSLTVKRRPQHGGCASSLIWRWSVVIAEGNMPLLCGRRSPKLSNVRIDFMSLKI